MIRRVLAFLFALFVRSRIHWSVIVRPGLTTTDRLIDVAAWDLVTARRRRCIATMGD